ncbi:non-heme iron oxygenase ferredoxin subunit [soil metagenome]
MAEDWRAVGKVGDLRTGDVIALELDGIRMVLGRDGDRYFAMNRQCVHRGGDLSEGIVSRGHIICPNHGWRFSTATGQAADASEFCVVTYPVRVVGEQIEIDPRPQQRTAP